MVGSPLINGKNGTTITNPKDIANKHAAAFTDNSSSTHYSATFQAIKEQEEKNKIDFTSDNTEVYNKPFRLRDLRRSIMKTKPRAPGPDGIHNNLLKHLPEDTLKILKEILNKIWTSTDFPHQWRAATVIPIPKPNKDHTDPLSYRPIALTSCLCKVLERMINTRFIWYLEKSGILDRSQCGFRKHRSTTDHLVSFERYLRDAFARRQQAVGLFFDLEKAYETTWQYGIIRDLHRIGLRGRLPVFVSEYLRDRRIRVRIGTTLSDEFYPEEGVPTGGVLAGTCFGLKINELPSCIAKDIFKALFVDDLAICFRGRSLDTIERHLQQAVNSIQEWATRNGFRFAAHKCKVVHFTAPRSRAQRPPIVRIGNSLLPVEESTKFLGLWWDSHLSFKKHISVLKTQCKEALNLIRVVAHLNPFICHIMNLLWSLSDKGTRVRFCWVPSHCGIDGNERVDQLAKETLDQDIDPLANVHYTDMKPLVNSYIQKLVQTKWDVAVHGRDLYLVKPTLGPPKKFQHLTRAEEVVITRLRIGHTTATKSHILSRGPPTGCHHCGETLTIDHMLLECALLQECRDEYYTVDSLNALFETIPETCIVEFLREAGFFYLIWCNSLTSTSPQTFTIWSDLSNYLENESNSETHLLV